jgi:hypothetical protein
LLYALGRHVGCSGGGRLRLDSPGVRYCTPAHEGEAAGCDLGGRVTAAAAGLAAGLSACSGPAVSYPYRVRALVGRLCGSKIGHVDNRGEGGGGGTHCAGRWRWGAL